MFLQSSVFPIVLYSVAQNGKADIKNTIGTGFFINRCGYFLTARHVIESAQAQSTKENLQIGLAIKDNHGESTNYLIAKLVTFEHAPKPYDVTIGKIEYSLKKLDKTFKHIDIEVWQRVATYGYPLNAISGDPTNIRLNLRAHKGIIQRKLATDDLPFKPSPPAYELSFLIGTGISGSPLFIYEEPNDVIIGICVGSSRSEEIDEIHEVKEGTTTRIERKISITEYGIAHDLVSLLTWAPSIGCGKSLLQISQE